MADTGQTDFSGMSSLANVEQAEFFSTALLADLEQDGSGIQDRNITDINNSVLGDETGSVQSDETGRVPGDETGLVLLSSISSNKIRGSEFSTFTLALADGTGLHTIPSYSTSIPSGTDDFAFSHT